MKNGLERAVAQIKKEGLPSAERMREDLARREAQDFQAMVQKKLSEYKTLFNRFTAGEDLTSEEAKRMTDLSDELTNLADSINKTVEKK